MVDQTHVLHTFIAQVTSEMASEYDRIFSRTAEDPGTAGDEGEENWATLLREWLPPTYHVATKGRLIGADGKMSPQVDVVVLKPFYPLKLREKRIWLANGVAAAFECKTTLRAIHIKECQEKSIRFKSLFAPRTGSPERELRSSLIYGMLAHSHCWKDPLSDPAQNVASALSLALEASARPADVMDLLCIADVGCWVGFALPQYMAEWAGPDKKRIEEIFGGIWGPVSSMVQATILDDNQQKSFQPVGGMIAYLTQRLAKNDVALRDLADYYWQAQLWGSGSGEMRYWPRSVFSDEVQRRIERGDCVSNIIWSEWNSAII